MVHLLRGIVKFLKTGIVWYAFLYSQHLAGHLAESRCSVKLGGEMEQKGTGGWRKRI